MLNRSCFEMENSVAWLLAFVFGLVPLLVWVLWSWNEFMFVRPLKTHKLPPGHMGLPILGELLTFIWYFQIARRPDDFINSKKKRYGERVGLYRTYLFRSPTVIACSPDSIKFVLQSSDLFSWNLPAKDIFGDDSLATNDVNLHTRLRSYVVNSVNSPTALKKITHIIQPHIVSSLSLWAEKGRVNGVHVVKKVLFEITISLFVSFKPGPRLDTLEVYFAGLIAGLMAQPLKLPGTTFNHALQCRKKLIAIFKEELEERKQSDGTCEDKNDVMEGLMRIRDEEGKPLSDDKVLDNIVGLVLGGYESTTDVLTWTLHYVAKYPSVAQKLREENLAINKKSEFLTIENIAQLSYTKKVVEETLRLSNNAAFVLRTAEKDVDYRGYRIPKGWNIIVWLRNLHIDPKNFEDPLSFNPDRWNEPPKAGTFLPFGAGSRTCAGNMLARTQLAIFLHHLVTGYKWELLNPNAKINYIPQPLPADGLEMVFSKLE